MIESLRALHAACANLPQGDAQAAADAQTRQSALTKPPGSLGRLEEIAIFMARWQGRARPQLARPHIVVFAANHGVAAQGVSAFPQAVTAQMVKNFARGGAAINQLATAGNATLEVIPLAIDTPTADITRGPAMSEDEFRDAFTRGIEAVPPDCDLLAVGEMGIGNTTAAAALCAALLGGDPADWVGRGTGVDDDGLARKREVIARALAANADACSDPFRAAAALGGRELAAIAGAVFAARRHSIPVLLDGFVATAAILPLWRAEASAITHCLAAHVSAEAAHRSLLARLGLVSLLDLGMRLGEASGAALAIGVVRAALACHNGMATFAEADVSDKL